MTSNAEVSPVTPLTPIPDAKRMEFLPRLFGHRLIVTGENAVYSFMEALSSDYHGGFWQFYETDEGALYMAPEGRDRMKLAWDGNGFDAEVSSDAAGIIATLFTLSHMPMSFRGCDYLADHYHRLLDFAAGHDESRLIFAAID